MPSDDSASPRPGPPADALRRVIGIVPGSLVSGAEAVLLRDLAAARRAGWEVRVACSDGPFVDRARAAGIERVAIPDLRLDDGHRALAFARLARRAVAAGRVLRRALRPGEVVLANGLNVLPATALVARTHRVVYFGHDVLIRQDRLALLRAVRRRVHLAVAVSDAVARSLAPARIPTVVVQNGTAWPAAPAPHPDPDAPPVIGIAAVVTPWKGQHVLLDALALVHHPTARVEIMGGTAPKDDEYAAGLRARADRSDIAGRVAFLGHVDAPLDRMRTWTITVLASVDPEAGPLTALESMSIGVPIVGTNHGGMTEVMGDAGVLVPPADPTALAAAIDRLLEDRDLWERCREAGPRQIVADRLTLADHERRMIELLDHTART